MEVRSGLMLSLLSLVGCTIQVQDPRGAADGTEAGGAVVAPAPGAAPAPAPAPGAAPAPGGAAAAVVKPKPAPAPVPVAPPAPGEVAKADLVVRGVELTGDTLSWDVSNRGAAAAAAGWNVRVEIATTAGGKPVVTVEQLSDSGIDSGLSVAQKVLVPQLFERQPELKTAGGTVEIVVKVDAANTLVEADESNNSTSVMAKILPPPPPELVVAPAVVPVEAAPAPAPVAPTTADVVLRRTDEEWLNVYIDGSRVYEVKNFATEHKMTLKPGSHKVVIKDFMDSEVLKEGTLTVVAGEEFVIGFSKGSLECFNNPAALK